MDTKLSLNRQLCFPFYALSRLITRVYQPHLEALGLTYPQYLVMLVLWEHEKIGMRALGEVLHLNSNTLSPLLKRMESQDLLLRKRSLRDERQLEVHLQAAGLALRQQAAHIPETLWAQVEEIGKSEAVDWESLEKNTRQLLRALAPLGQE
ncbi:MAG: MarR family winged helix-turn-helix transcriptional regulator [Nitritalea sp.]